MSSLTLSVDRQNSPSDPWAVPALVAAATLVSIGLSWDISWHQTIGRDTFWTPAHVVIYLGGASGGLICGWLAIRTTYFATPHERAGSVGLWGGFAPFGAWIAIWGAVAMLTSGPFDNWWHNAYGLDVKILSPPHVLLFLGVLGIRVGTWLLALREQNRPGGSVSAGWYFSWMGGLVMGGTIGLLLTQVWPNRQHSAGYFLLVSIVFPFFLAAIGRAAKLRWGTTIAAGGSMLLTCAIIWILQLFPATPRLGPIYHPVTHMVPPPFPQWEVLPALVIDLLRPRVDLGRGGWRRDLGFAVALGAIFLAVFLPFQWEFSRFYLTPAANNWFFAGGRNWSYNTMPGPRWTEFFPDESGWRLHSVLSALVAAVGTSFLGLRFGSWMTRVATMTFRPCLALAAAWWLIVGPAQAHIGSPAVVFDGAAGPYPVRVIILPPAVIPGRAEINVRMLQDETEPVKVTVLPVYWRAGLAGAPPADEATGVPGEPSLRHGELWLMSPGSYSVHVAVEGARGRGTVIVPVDATATQRLAMPRGLGALLLGLGGLLFVGAVTLVGTGVRQSVLPPDALLSASQRRRGYVAVVVAAIVLGASLYAARKWWSAVDRDYRNNEIYRAAPLEATVTGAGDTRVLHLHIEREGTYAQSRLLLIPDHGKLMHLFMIREPQLDALAHLHPVRIDSRSFDVAVPPLPDGVYRLYADITYETGFAATLTTTVDLGSGTGAPSASAPPPRDPDDSWHLGGPEAAPVPGPRLVLLPGPELRVGEDVNLGFAVQDEAGRPVEIEPYMGMRGHAAVRRSDGSVFAHLHPVGTISMASQDFFTKQAARETGTDAPMDHSLHLRHGGAGNTVSIPYLFPQPGSYRLWAQTKVAGRVITGVFDLEVASAPR